MTARLSEAAARNLYEHGFRVLTGHSPPLSAADAHAFLAVVEERSQAERDAAVDWAARAERDLAAAEREIARLRALLADAARDERQSASPSAVREPASTPPEVP